jgi:hypothetical protein
MKKTIVAILALVIGSSTVMAQSNAETIRNAFFVLNQKAKAKEDLDKAMTSTKFNSKPEAYILKAAMYAALALEETNKDKPSGDQFISDAKDAFNKYKQMDNSMAMLGELYYSEAPVNLYRYYYGAGYLHYNNKDSKTAYEKLKLATEFSDLLIEKKVLTATLDTNLHVLAGITAEQSGNKDAALTHYTKLADAKVAGSDFESIYRFLVSQYFGRKDFVNFEKYKALGASLYPKGEYCSRLRN